MDACTFGERLCCALQVDRLKCLVHRITLQQLLGQDILQPARASHLQALLEQPPGCTMNAESVADRILERTAHRPLPPEQPAALTLQHELPPRQVAPALAEQDSPVIERADLSAAAAASSAGPGLGQEDSPSSEGGSRAANARCCGRGTRQDGVESGVASVSGSECGGTASSAGSPAARAAADGLPAGFQEAAAAAPPSPHRTGGDARSAAGHGSSSCEGEEEQDSPPQYPAAAGISRAADVGHLTPTAMHAGLRVAAARAKAAKLGARLDSVLAVRGGDMAAQ